MATKNTPAARRKPAAPVSRDVLGVSRLVAMPFYVLAFFSGAAALIYEVTWAKMLSLTFGSTTLAGAAVVAGFMGGMGLGAWLYHLVAARSSRPLVLYAGLEIVIAITTAVMTAMMYALPAVFARLSVTIGTGMGLDVMRFGAVLLLLFVPAAFIGATFPALCAVMIRTAPGVDRHLGAIYGINTIGAAVGVLVGGLFLIEQLGLTASVRVANVLNVAVGIGAVVLLRSPLGTGSGRGALPADSVIPTTLPRLITGLALVVSGFCTLGYEILWFRGLRYLTGTSTHAFTIVLFTFLIGLGLGALLLRQATRRGRPEVTLAVCQCLIALLALGAIGVQLAFSEVPALREQVSIFVSDVRFSPWWKRLLIDAGVSVGSMLPATIFMGLSFPLATRLFLGDVRKLDARVGTAYLLANVGSIAGAVAGASILLPLAGTLTGTKVCAVLNVLLAVVIFGAIGWGPRWSRTALKVTAVVVVAAIILIPGEIKFRGEKLEDDVPGNVVFVREGDLATVQVLESPTDPSKRAMAIDGYKIGWSDGYEGTIFYRKQIILSHLPMVLEPGIRRTLAIGLASGATLEALATYPEIEALHCVEINPAVVEANELFPGSAVLDDPRARLIVDDAVHYLLRTDERYDLIVSDGKQDAYSSTNAALLCREFYELAAARLTDDGLFVQWNPLSTLYTDFRVILRTMMEAFEHVDFFFMPPESVVMVGSSRPLGERVMLDDGAYEAGPAGAGLSRYLLPTKSSLLAHWVADETELAAVIGDGPESTWDRLILDYTPFRATIAEWVEAAPKNLATLLSAETVGSGLGLDAEDPYAQSVRLVRHANFALMNGEVARARELAQRALAANPEDPGVRLFLNRLP